MCGRFALSAVTSKVEKLVPESKSGEKIKPRYNIAPSQKIKALLNDGEREITDVKWGLIPFWAKDESIGMKMINARSETIAEKKSFISPLKRKRCLIYSDGFYEWKKTPGQKIKTPYFIRMKSKEPFTFAGLWETWKNENGEKILSATIITTEPNEVTAEIHDRMPAILLPNDREKWISPEEENPLEMKALLRPYPAGEMEAYIVSKNVNKASFDSPSCIEPAH